MFNHLLIGFFSFFFFLFSSISATIINIPEDTTSIQGGIYLATEGDTVLVADGNYMENINFKGKSITVTSHFLMDGDTNHISNTVIDGSQPVNADSGSVVSFISDEDTTSILCGFTITGGTGLFYQSTYRAGGGIYLLNCGAKIIHNQIISNNLSGGLACAGAGIYQGLLGIDDWVIIEDNIINNNQITGTDWGTGGGIFIGGNTRITNNIIEQNVIRSQSDVAIGGGINCVNDNVFLTLTRKITHNIIRYNQALAPNSTQNDGGMGGGIYIDGRTAEIAENIITHNEIQGSGSTKSYGAGLMLLDQDATATIHNNIISHNRCLNTPCRGAGVTIWSTNFPCNPWLINNIIAYNRAGIGANTVGGGIYIGGHQPNLPHLENNTIAYNSASWAGSAIFSDSTHAASHTTVVNTILWGNTSSQNSQIFLNGGTMDVTYSDVQGGYPGPGNIDSNPLFLKPESLWFCLDTLSPCIDSGDSSLLDPEDPSNLGYALWPARGGIRSDMGAFGGAWGCDWHPAITSLEKKVDDNAPITNTVQLFQNYPNPFNPTTVISFQLAVGSPVNLSVYNTVGQKITELINEIQPPGKYSIEFHAEELSSGIYFYRLETGDFVETHKMILMK